MIETPVLRRSALYMPGSNARALEKARSLPADVLIFDLEDSVAPDAKVPARDRAIGAVASGYGNRECVIRINGLDTPWGTADIAAVARSGADAVLVPKIDTVEDLERIEAMLAAYQAPPQLDLWAMIETPRAVQVIDAIAGAGRRLRVLVMGTADLATALRIEPDPQRSGLVASLSRCVVAARAAGIDILDGIDAVLDDDAGFQQSCIQGKTLGFDGKTLIHPRQIDTANTVFGVSPDELEQARTVAAAWDAAAVRGEGIAVVDGRMIEQLHANAARRTIDRAAAIRRAAASPDNQPQDISE